MSDELAPLFSPEWLARFSPSPGLRSPGGYLTARDCGAILHLVGRFSSTRVDMADDTDHWALLTERHPERTCYRRPGGFGPLRPDGPDGDTGLFPIDVVGARRALGLERTKEAMASLTRAMPATVGHHGEFVARVEVLEDGLHYALAPNALAAHPANSPSRRGVALDPARIASFRSVQSVPVAARAIAWLYTPCRVGLPPNSKVDRAEGRDRARSVSLRIPAAEVPKALGLAQMGVWSPSLLKAQRIAADMLTVGVESEWNWHYQGRTPIMLSIVMRPAPKTPIRASKVSTGSRTYQVRAALAVYDDKMEAKGHAKRPRGRPRKVRPVVDDISHIATISDADYDRLHHERGQPRDVAQVATLEPANDLTRGPYANLRTPEDFAAARAGVADDLARSMGRPPEDKYDEGDVWADYQSTVEEQED